MEIADGSTVIDLLETLQIDPDAVVVELNLDIPDKKTLGTLKLKSGDSVEIIRMVSGG
jgi:thiamine biosynthesis protein ThiS